MRIAVLSVTMALASACFDAAVADVPRFCTVDDDCQADEVCDGFVGLCRERTETPPQLAAARFEPAVTSDGSARFIVRATAPLLAAEAESDDARVNVGAAVVDSDTASFEVTVSDTVDGDDDGDLDELVEGFFRVERARLVAEDGAVIELDIDPSAILLVDATAPIVANVAVSDATPSDGVSRISDLSPDDVFTVSAVVGDGAVADVVMTVGAQTHRLDDGCEVGAGFVVRCAFDVNAGGLLDGENLGTVVAVDSAGNVSPAVPLSVAVDTRAPTVAAGTFVRVTRGARVLEVAEPGATIELVLALSEPAPVAPDVVLDLDGAVVAFASDGGQGAVWRFSVTLGDDDFSLAAGAQVTLAIRASFADAVGHRVVDVPVPAAAPFDSGVPFASAIGAGCAKLPGMQPCVDADGDGFLFLAPDCPAGEDRDDTDARVFPGSPHIADDEALFSRAVFVSDVGDDLADGSIATPLGSLDVAIETLINEAGAGRDVVVLGGVGPFFVAEPIPNGVSVVGGYSASFVPIEGRRAEVFSGGFLQMEGPWLRAIETDALLLGDAVRLVDDVRATFDVDSEATRVTLANVTGSELAIEAGARARLVDVDLEGLLVFGDVDAVRVRERVRGTSVFGALRVTSSALTSVSIVIGDRAVFHAALTSIHGDGRPVTNNGSARVDLQLLSCSLFSDTAVLEPPIGPFSSSSRLVIVNNSLGLIPNQAAVEFDDETINIDTLNFGGFETIAGSRHNVDGDPRLSIADPLRPRLDSPLIQSELIDVDAALLPPEAVTDLDRQCRFNDDDVVLGADDPIGPAP